MNDRGKQQTCRQCTCRSFRVPDLLWSGVGGFLVVGGRGGKGDSGRLSDVRRFVKGADQIKFSLWRCWSGVRGKARGQDLSVLYMNSKMCLDRRSEV